MKWFFTFIFTSFLLVSSVYAAPKKDTKFIDGESKEVTIQNLQHELEKIKKELTKDSSIWTKSYNSYMAYQASRKSLREVHRRISELKNRRMTSELRLEIEALQAKEKVLLDQIDGFRSQGPSPFASLLKPDTVEETPKISNPFAIITGLSYIKRLDGQYKDYEVKADELRELTDIMERQVALYRQLMKLDPKVDYEVELDATLLQIEKFKLALDTLTSTADVYGKRIESIEAKINKEIKDQLYKLLNIGWVIIVLFVIAFLIKRIVKRYITDNERFYMANKILTFVTVTLVIIVLIFTFMDNVGYIATVLGFASAGLAIALRDWFMSIIGWFVIVFGGSIHVGNRIRVEKDGMVYVGDVLDISLQRITIHEDITLTTVMQNRRAGRIIFIPNNYIFTSLIANYSHGTLSTVWDGVDITITFASNHKKATLIVKEICRKYSKGYTEMTRKQINKLRDRYSLKNANVEPRIFTFIEPNGLKVSGWYLTNAYATLTLRSTISAEIIDAFNAEYDIAIAYPTQTFYTGPIEKKQQPIMDDA